jgi:cytoplasmic iron level regulating protein YaaA (DUF328/UPF0246 family)
MIVLLSPAKSLDYSPKEYGYYSQPRLLEKSEELVGTLKKKSSKKLQELMGVSKNIADLNVERFNSFSVPFKTDNSKPAIYAFNGDVYTGLQAEDFVGDEIEFAQKHIRILSGLYGLLKPLDLIQPYRLEMGTRLKHKRKNNLYEFWGKTITELINNDLAESGSNVVVNLASNEYFHAVKPAELKGEILNIDFKENRDGVLKIISFNAKKARGKMAHLIVKENITKKEQLKELVVDGYVFDENKSDDNYYCFIK